MSFISDIEQKWQELKAIGHSVVATTLQVRSGTRKRFIITAPDGSQVGRIITDDTPDLESIKEATVYKIETWENSNV